MSFFVFNGWYQVDSGVSYRVSAFEIYPDEKEDGGTVLFFAGWHTTFTLILERQALLYVRDAINHALGEVSPPPTFAYSEN